ncbi:ThiF family adenylyltransferase [Conexibacter sp. JD483]|uniref:ThiF family adenylyltransferase n=1 Tax=unclassified Conexibacter TaxID=2627773 RepID=UPI00271B53F7|nr:MULTISPECIES: ThiF family adenylyltransferase [unclassified Conexibacter]MDO8185971.1 ThiF family adenylyltransferase [Conexibacter sp. CPCC 205706]MDO8199462.1 ThiF family adenylyltransferase [Conexibacter sp. CPCC 205762]MDR9368580.1 ThiF family adenylyltransferase [Conexibacter sp. JD483]
MGLNDVRDRLEVRLAEERAALAAAGIEILSEHVAVGLTVWTCEMEHDLDPVEITISIGDGFPWLPPEISSPAPFLQRHQVPSRDGSFCLDRTDAPWWSPQRTIVELLEHLQGLLDADTAGASRVDEADMAEPASAYLSEPGFPVMLLPATLLRATLGAEAGRLRLHHLSGRRDRWLVTAVTAKGVKLDVATEARPSWIHLDKQSSVDVAWSDLGTVRDLNGIRRAERHLLAVASRQRVPRKRDRARQRWHAITYLEEGPTRNQTRRAWSFARLDGVALQFASTQALSMVERSARRRGLVELGDARVTIFGAGSVGSMVAMQLAQAGVRLMNLVDHDRYDVNNGVRHVLPADYFGEKKASATAAFINAHQPFCSAKAHEILVGGVPGSVDAAADLIRESDLVVDSTGEVLVGRLLGDLSAQVGVPILRCALLEQGRYGYVFVRGPTTGDLDQFLDLPELPDRSEETSSNYTPYSCSHPAVSCAPFQPAELAIRAVRIAAGVLSTTPSQQFAHDWLIVRLDYSGDVQLGSLPREHDL